MTSSLESGVCCRTLRQPWRVMRGPWRARLQKGRIGLGVGGRAYAPRVNDGVASTALSDARGSEP
eukprot:scaffold232893_cov30-Tisochrysis_lutea.AAC.1